MWFQKEPRVPADPGQTKKKLECESDSLRGQEDEKGGLRKMEVKKTVWGFAAATRQACSRNHDERMEAEDKRQ